MQNRHRFKSFPAAEFYARGMLGIDWPFGEASYRDKPTTRELVSPLMTELTALKLADKFILQTPDNASAIHTVKSRIFNPNKYRVAIKLSALTCTRDELVRLQNSLAHDKETQLKLLGNFLNETHAPFGEKFWAVRRSGEHLYLTYMAPGKSYQNIPLISEDGQEVYDENHSGREYKSELLHNFNRQNSGFYFSDAMQADIRRNLQCLEYNNNAYYYFNDDYIPSLVNMLHANLMPSKLEQQQRANLLQTHTSTESSSSEHVRIPPSPPETHAQKVVAQDGNKVRKAMGPMTGSSGFGMFGKPQARLDAEFGANAEREIIMSSDENKALLPCEDNDDADISSSCCLN